MQRIDFIEIDSTLKTVYVKDDFGVYVMHDVAARFRIDSGVIIADW